MVHASYCYVNILQCAFFALCVLHKFPGTHVLINQHNFSSAGDDFRLEACDNTGDEMETPDLKEEGSGSVPDDEDYR